MMRTRQEETGRRIEFPSLVGQRGAGVLPAITRSGAANRGRDQPLLRSPALRRRSVVFSGPPDQVPRLGSACALPKREFGRHVIDCLIVRLSRIGKVERNY